MSRDEQEALSRRYCDDIVLLLPLKSGAIAVFNKESRTLCGIIPANTPPTRVWPTALNLWRPPSKPTRPSINLDELGLL